MDLLTWSIGGKPGSSGSSATISTPGSRAGSRLHDLGWPVHYVRDLLGHASLSTTNTYLNVTRAELVESMQQAGEARNRCKISTRWTKHG